MHTPQRKWGFCDSATVEEEAESFRREVSLLPGEKGPSPLGRRCPELTRGHRESLPPVPGAAPGKWLLLRPQPVGLSGRAAAEGAAAASDRPPEGEPWARRLVSGAPKAAPGGKIS